MTANPTVSRTELADLGSTGAILPKPARSPGRPSRQEAEALHEAVLDAAMDAFLENGFEAASMEGIARKAGVAKITLYRHYETKEQLFVAVTRRGQLSVRNSLDGLANKNLPLDQVLRRIIDRLYAGYTDPRYVAVSRMVFAEALHFPKLGHALLCDTKYMCEPLVDYLQYLKDSEQIAVDSAYEAAMQIAGLASGAGRYVMVQPSLRPEARRHWVESLVKLFTHAWRVDKP